MLTFGSLAAKVGAPGSSRDLGGVEMCLILSHPDGPCRHSLLQHQTTCSLIKSLTSYTWYKDISCEVEIIHRMLPWMPKALETQIPNICPCFSLCSQQSKMNRAGKGSNIWLQVLPAQQHAASRESCREQLSAFPVQTAAQRGSARGEHSQQLCWEIFAQISPCDFFAVVVFLSWITESSIFISW